MQYAVTRETSRKWLVGLAMPELERLIAFARDFDCSFEWLATGRGDRGLSLRVAEAPARYAPPMHPEVAKLVAWVVALPVKRRRGLMEFLGIE